MSCAECHRILSEMASTLLLIRNIQLEPTLKTRLDNSTKSIVACDSIEGTWRRSGQSSSEVIDYCWIYTEHSDIHI